MKDSPTAVPIEFAGDPIAWTAWLYFAEHLTQNEVAREIGVSRATIANYLTEARTRGLVSINIAPDILANIEMGREIASRFGLTGAHIVPVPDDSANPDSILRDRLGAAGAHVLECQLKPDMRVGVAWGRTMLALGNALPAKTVAGCKVVQVAGSSVDGDDAAPEVCTALIASKLGARCANFHAPAIVSNPALLDSLLQEPSLMSQFSLIEDCQVLVFGVSELDEDVRFADATHLSADITRTYLDNGAIGVALARFVDRDGLEVDGPLSGRIIGISLETVKSIPERILVAGGVKKAEAIRASIGGGYVTQLVTDSRTAATLLS